MTFPFDQFEANEDEYQSVDEFLADLDDALRERLAGTTWEDALAPLNAETPLEERLALYQRLRASGILPEEATFFLVAWTLETLARERAAELLEAQYDPRFARLEKKYGEELDGADVPDEYRALHIEFNQAVQSLLVATFQAFGEGRMARLLRQQPPEFDRLYNAGYEYFFGPTTESTLEGLWQMKAND
jgi:hypothetical protein